MKVYLSMACEWCEDPYIIGVYSTRELAETAGNAFIKMYDEHDKMYVNIKELTIDG